MTDFKWSPHGWVVTFTGSSLSVLPGARHWARSGVALQLGRGRVVILGEAAMMTAQISGDGHPFGMNVPGNDDRQLALNILHWLSRLE